MLNRKRYATPARTFRKCQKTREGCLVNDNRDMIIHILLDTSQATGGQNRHAAKGNTDVVDILVTLGVRDLARGNDHLVGGLVAGDAGDDFQLVKQGRHGQLNGVDDVRYVRDVEFGHHQPADVVRGIGDEFLDEDVEVDCVADGAADHADREGQSGYGGDEILQEGVIISFSSF
jgi:hypothetical protein